MKKQRITFAFTMTYLWAMMVLLGSILFDTLVLYPDIFHDVPRSLETTMEFMAVRGPGDFFPHLGMLSWLTGIGSLVLNWREKSTRYWILGSLIMIVCQGLVSMAFSGRAIRSCSRRVQRSILLPIYSKPPKSFRQDTG